MVCLKKKRGTRDKSRDLHYKSYGIRGKTCGMSGKKKACRYKITSLIRVLLFHLNAKRRAATYLGVEHIDFAVVVFLHNPFG